MNSSTSNAEQAVSFDFLVKVTGDKLELQHDLLRSLLVPYIDSEVPVAIVTVIGQPKSRKTLLTNFIQTRIIRSVGKESKQFGTVVTPTFGFPRSVDDCPSKSVRDKLDGQQGVLIWTKPCLVQQKDGQQLAVFILDIWSKNPSPRVYTRLVDFCITSSSMVILVEDCCVSKESNWNQWDISKSFLAQLKGREFQNLTVLIHANWEKENFRTLGLEGGKRFMNASKGRFSQRLNRVIDSGHILRGYFKDASYFLAQLKRKSTVQKGKKHSSDSYHIQGLLEFSSKVVGYDPSKLFPLAPNKTSLSTLSVESLFRNGIVISNSEAAVTEATDATTFQQNNVVDEMEVCEEKLSTYTQTDVEAGEAAIENQFVPVDETYMEGNMEVTSSFEESTNSSSQSELDKSEANQLNLDASEISDDDDFVIVDKPTETISVSSHSSVLGGNIDEAEEAMDQMETPEKPLETSKVPVLELKHGGYLVEAYRIKLDAFIEKSSQAQLFFKDEDLESLHLQFKSQIWEDFWSQFRGPQAEEFLETMNAKFDKMFTDFKQVNSESKRLYYLYLSEGENNLKEKFDPLIEQLRIQVSENPLEIIYDPRNDDLESYYEGFTENLPVKLKNYFSLWYSWKSDEFKTDFDSMKAMIQSYQEKMQMVLISSTCKTKKEFEVAHVLYSKNAEEMAINHKWSYTPLNDIAKEAVVRIKKIFSRCINLTNNTLEVHKTGLQAFIDGHANNGWSYVEDDQLMPMHNKLKANIVSDVTSKIPPLLVGVLVEIIETGCDEIFSDFVTKYSEERTSFSNFYQQMKLNSKLRFDKEVTELELQMKKDPPNLSYDLKKTSLNNYVKILTRNVPDSKWKKYFISWYSNELDDFRKDVHAMISAIQFYRDQWKTFFRENVCVKENEFHEAHNSFAELAAGDNNHTWKNSRLKLLSGNGIELARQRFNQLNSDIINKEEEMAKEASIFAEVHYNSLMKSQISARALTDSEVRTFHETCVKAVVDSFHEVPQFKYTYVWQRHLNELGNRLHNQLPSYLKENQQNVDRVQKTKKKLMCDCTKVYNDSMNKVMSDKKVSEKMLRSHHNRSTKEALQILNLRMNSIEEKFDKKSWGKELEEKLQIHFNTLVEENNKKSENEPRNHEPTVAASVDYGNVKSTQSCGVGIYFGPDIVRLGIYVNGQTITENLEFCPFVTFERNEIVFFKPRSNRCDHFDVYQTLVKVENFPRTVFVSGKSYQLWGEEIVAVFLNKIKSEAETRCQLVLTSCTVAVSAFMSTSSKHMLKTALTLAGFERNTIIHSTTAVGLSYVVTSKVQGDSPAIFIHQTGSVFDVATAVISQKSISIRRISGLPYLEKSSYLSQLVGQHTLNNKVKKLISSTIHPSEFSAWQLKAQVMVQGKKNFISDRSAITEPLLGYPLTTLDEAQGIVLGAAAFNAFQNKIPGAPHLEYTEVFPYTFTAQVDGKQIKSFVSHNMPVISDNLTSRFSLNDVSNRMKLRITEFAVENEKIFVSEYTINAVNSKCRNFFLFVNFNYEGLIEVEAQTRDLKTFPVQIRTKGLAMAQQFDAMENLRPILIRTAAPRLPNIPVNCDEVKAIAGAVENEMTPPVVVAQDSKTKLVDLIADVKDRLAKSTTTNPMIVTRIIERIKESEELVGKDDVKEKQIEMQIKFLELAAAKIK